MLDPEEYEHFVNTLTQFKDRLGDDLDGATPLRECLVTDISRILYSNFGATLGTFTLEQMLNNISNQDKQSQHSWLISLQKLDRIKCANCEHQCDFSEKIILALFLKGLQNTDLQQDA